MGAFYNGVCFDSSSVAADAYYSGAPVSHQAGATSYTSSFSKPAGSWLWSITENDGVNVVSRTVAAPIPDFAACDPVEAMVDGAAVGWLFGGLLFVTWALLMVRRQLR